MIIREHPKMLAMRADRYATLYKENPMLAKQWYYQFVPVEERVATNKVIKKEFEARGM